MLPILAAPDWDPAHMPRIIAIAVDISAGGQEYFDGSWLSRVCQESLTTDG
jgi:hypothetical protein